MQHCLRFETHQTKFATNLQQASNLAKKVGIANQSKFLLFADETLSNILRHSNSSSIVLTLCRYKDSIRVSVYDDGAKFNSVTTSKKSKGLTLVTKMFPSLSYQRRGKMNLLVAQMGSKGL